MRARSAVVPMDRANTVRAITAPVTMLPAAHTAVTLATPQAVRAAVIVRDTTVTSARHAVSGATAATAQTVRAPTATTAHHAATATIAHRVLIALSVLVQTGTNALDTTVTTVRSAATGRDMTVMTVPLARTDATTARARTATLAAPQAPVRATAAMTVARATPVTTAARRTFTRQVGARLHPARRCRARTPRSSGNPSHRC